MVRHGLSSPALRRWALIAYWALMFVSTHWPDPELFEPEGGWPIPEFDRVMHVGVYIGWVAMWWWVLSARGQSVSRSTAVWLLLGAAAYAVFDELTQSIVGRQPDVVDFLCDLGGTLAALLLLRAWQRKGWRPRPP